MGTKWTAKATFMTASNGQYFVTGYDQTMWRARSDGTSVYVAKSTDEGANWGGDVTVATSDTIPLDQPFFYDEVQGRLHLFYGRLFHNVGSKPGLYSKHSDDQGATWSSEVTVESGASRGNYRFYRIAGHAYNSILTIILTSESDTDFSTDGLFVYRSTDGGATYGAATQIYTGVAISPTRPESYWDGSKLYAVWTDPLSSVGTWGNVYYSYSTDQGSTWLGSPKQLTTGQQTGRPDVYATGTGNVVAVWMQDFGTGVSSDLWGAYSIDYGVTWSTPFLITAHTGATGYGYSHSFLIGNGKDVYLFWDFVGASPNTQLMEKISNDAGVSWGADQVVWTYGDTTGVADAPMIVKTNGMLHAFGWETSGSVQYAKNPYFLPTPNLNNVVFSGGADAGPPPTSNWRGGNNITADGGGDGLVILSNALTATNNGHFRQGSSWKFKLGKGQANTEVGVRISADSVSDFDGFSLFTREQNAGTSGASGYYTDWFQDPTGNMNLKRFDSSVTGAVITTGPLAQNFSVGDIIFLSSYGTRHFIWVLYNGDTDWTLLVHGVDATYPNDGLLGIDVQNGQTLRFDRAYMGPIGISDTFEYDWIGAAG